MPTTVLNPSFDSAAKSDDNLLMMALQMDAKWALCRNSPKLLTKCRSVGMTTIYRSTNDGTLDQDAAQLVQNLYNAAPDADYLHVWNEVGLPSTIDAKTRTAANKAHALGKHIIALNVETNYDLAAWKAQTALIHWLLDNGHGIGLHIYLDGLSQHDAGGLAPLQWLLDTFGGLICLTEFAPIESIFNRDRGWRAMFGGNALKLIDWLDAIYVQYPVLREAIAFLFSVTHWQNDAQGQQVGFGTEDHATIQQHIGTVINAKYSVEMKPVTQLPVHVDPPTTGGLLRVVKSLPAGISWRNIRTEPDANAQDLGDLVVGDVITEYETRPDGWGYLTRAKDGVKGWALFNGIEMTPVYVPTFTFHAPFTQYKIVSHFNAPRPGYTTDYPGKKPLHEGTDFEPADGVACDAVVHIGAACTVTQVGDQSPIGYGKFILVDFGNGFTMILAHFAEIYVKAGQALIDGQIVGLMGQTGSASEPHVHVSLSNPAIGLDGYVYAKVCNPEDFLA